MQVVEKESELAECGTQILHVESHRIEVGNWEGFVSLRLVNLATIMQRQSCWMLGLSCVHKEPGEERPSYGVTICITAKLERFSLNLTLISSSWLSFIYYRA